VDDLLGGGLLLGAITEIIGADCSGHTSFTLSFLASVTRADKVCAWIDVSNALQPESAAAMGIDLSKMLWVRCGVPTENCAQNVTQQSFALPAKYLFPAPIKKGLHGGGCGGHPRNEIKGLADSVTGLLKPEAIYPLCAEPLRRTKPDSPSFKHTTLPPPYTIGRSQSPSKPCHPMASLDQAIRVTDLLLQGGGFSAIVLDMAGIASELSSRVPLATWFRYRAAAERSQTSLVLLTQHCCAKSSAELVLNIRPGNPLSESTIFTGMNHQIQVSRQRFNQNTTNVIPLKKPTQKTSVAAWQCKSSWAGRA
jgi:hypothetical protein